MPISCQCQSHFTSSHFRGQLLVLDQVFGYTPYSRSSRQVWQTFFSLLQVWHTSVFLKRMRTPGHQRNTVNGLAQIWDRKKALGSLCTELPFCFLHGNKLQSYLVSSNHKYINTTKAQEIPVSIWCFTLTGGSFREGSFLLLLSFIAITQEQIYSKIYKFSLIPGDVSVELLEMNYSNGYIRQQHSSNPGEVTRGLVQKTAPPSSLMMHSLPLRVQLEYITQSQSVQTPNYTFSLPQMKSDRRAKTSFKFCQSRQHWVFLALGNNRGLFLRQPTQITQQPWITYTAQPTLQVFCTFQYKQQTCRRKQGPLKVLQ